jgi:myo-inositol-1(or 4)-monophosphatase
MNRELIFCMRAVVEAGKLVRAFHQELTTVGKKSGSPRDIVSQVDIVAEQTVWDMLTQEFPGDPLLGEERGMRGEVRDRLWILDPLDGTVNYVFGIPLAATSLAVMEKGRLIAGAIYNPFLNELYYAARGFGAFLNEKKLHVQPVSYEEGLHAVAFSNRGETKTAREREFTLFRTVNDETRGCLRTGSAAMNLCYVAAGRLSGAWGIQGKVWDLAAGLLIAEEAGATIDLFGGDLQTTEWKVSYCAATSANVGDLRARILATVLDAPDAS